MELIPKQMVVGVYMPPTPTQPGTEPGGQASAERLTRIWAEVGPRFGYRRFELSPDSAAVRFEGTTELDSVIIEPPLVQVRGNVQTTVDQFADNAYSIFKTVSGHLGVHAFFNLGVRLIYHAPAPNHDGRAFVMGKLLMRTPEDFATVQRGGQLWVGVKFMIDEGDASHVLHIEPFLADNSFIFLDLDTSYLGEIDLDAVKTRTANAETYLRSTVASYLDSLVG